MDEWNVWHRNGTQDYNVDSYTVGPVRVENNFDMADALVFSGMMCVLINNCDRVKMACLAQLVNVIAPVMTEKGGRMLKQTIYYPFKSFAKNAVGKIALSCVTDTETYISEEYGETPYLRTAVVFDEKKDEYTAFAVNISSEETEVEFSVSDDGYYLKSAETFGGVGLSAKNTFDDPYAVLPETVEIDGKQNKFVMKGYSVGIFVLKK